MNDLKERLEAAAAASKSPVYPDHGIWKTLWNWIWVACHPQISRELRLEIHNIRTCPIVVSYKILQTLEGFYADVFVSNINSPLCYEILERELDLRRRYPRHVVSFEIRQYESAFTKTILLAMPTEIAGYKMRVMKHEDLGGGFIRCQIRLEGVSFHIPHSFTFTFSDEKSITDNMCDFLEFVQMRISQ